jgi:urocanate hydratase
VSAPRGVRAARGLDVRCRGWRQEALLRLLENVLEVGERPEDLVVYAATARAVRNWDCYDATVAALRDLREDETLVMQSGKPVGVFRSTAESPLVVMANANLVGRWATDDCFRELDARGLIMYGGYTAGDWQYIGQQGVLQTTYETLAACAREGFGGSLASRVFLSSGLGAMGGAQPLAAKLLGAAALIVEVDEARADRRLRDGYLDATTHDVEAAVRQLRAARERGEAASLALIGNAASVLPRLRELGLRPDVVTDQTSAHDALYGYVPDGVAVTDAVALRSADPAGYQQRAMQSMARQVETMVGFQDDGAVVFEYGNAIREQALRAGYARANAFDGFVKRFVRPMFCLGRGPCRWIALSGDPADIEAIDLALLREFGDDPVIAGWIDRAMQSVPHQGLPARTSWFSYAQRLQFGLLANRMVAEGAVSAPLAMTRDHMDCGAVAQPTRETEGMPDGSDPIADWPLLNALLNAGGGADLVAIHQGAGSGMGGSISAGVTLVIDGTEACRAKLERVLRTDPGIGVLRHADAGLARALETVDGSDLVMPMRSG